MHLRSRTNGPTQRNRWDTRQALPFCSFLFPLFFLQVIPERLTVLTIPPEKTLHAYDTNAVKRIKRRAQSLRCLRSLRHRRRLSYCFPFLDCLFVYQDYLLDFINGHWTFTTVPSCTYESHASLPVFAAHDLPFIRFGYLDSIRHTEGARPPWQKQRTTESPVHRSSVVFHHFKSGTTALPSRKAVDDLRDIYRQGRRLGRHRGLVVLRRLSQVELRLFDQDCDFRAC